MTHNIHKMTNTKGGLDTMLSEAECCVIALISQTLLDVGQEMIFEIKLSKTQIEDEITAHLYHAEHSIDIINSYFIGEQNNLRFLN